jgi:hypothetical protein
MLRKRPSGGTSAVPMRRSQECETVPDSDGKVMTGKSLMGHR